ncbi:DUF6483 family protein [Paenibacillus sp. M1]|uniref:DUF6483 family protein n=1 Tax=Paenibacillus haidiansis TaxID=1574488 RepID=A0ABU7VZR9_9BACL
MLRKDYLVRMIEEMTEILGKVFDLKQRRKWTEALWELDELYKRQFRLNSALLGSLSAKDTVELFRTGGQVEADKLQSLARLLREEGELFTESGERDEGILRQMKALHLFLAAAQYGADRNVWKLDEEIGQLLTRLKGYRLPADTERLLLAYEESEGRYDRAEDALYRLLRLGAADKEEGVNFYRRLLTLTQERLERGGLPEEEVREGMDSWLERGWAPAEDNE